MEIDDSNGDAGPWQFIGKLTELIRQLGRTKSGQKGLLKDGMVSELEIAAEKVTDALISVN